MRAGADLGRQNVRRQSRPELTAGASEIAHTLHSPGVRLRCPLPELRRKRNTDRKAGHIPRSFNHFYQSNMNSITSSRAKSFAAALKKASQARHRAAPSAADRTWPLSQSSGNGARQCHRRAAIRIVERSSVQRDPSTA